MTGVGPTRVYRVPVGTTVRFTGAGTGGGGTQGHPPTGVLREIAKVVVPRSALVSAAQASVTVTVPLKLQLGVAEEEATNRVSSCSQPPVGAVARNGQARGVTLPSVVTLTGRPDVEEDPLMVTE